jgi:hypothetical protein
MIANALYYCTSVAALLFCIGALLTVLILGGREARWDATGWVLMLSLCVMLTILLITFGALVRDMLPPR